MQRVARQADAEWETPKRRLACAACGYGVVRAAPPARCPMCQAEGPWRPEPLLRVLVRGAE